MNEEKIKVAKYFDDFKGLGLTIKEAKFAIAYYANGFNAPDAYRRAGYAGADKEWGKFQSYKITKRTPVEKAIKLLAEQDLGVKTEVIKSKVISQLYEQAFYDPSDFINADGSPKFERLEDLPREKRCCVKKVETKRYGRDGDYQVTSIDLADRNKAMEVLGKHIGLFKEEAQKVEVGVSQETQDLVAKIWEEGVGKNMPYKAD